jgi:hypothetical protein
MWCRLIWLKDSGISEKNIASIFRIEEHTKQAERRLE